MTLRLPFWAVCALGGYLWGFFVGFLCWGGHLP